MHRSLWIVPPFLLAACGGNNTGSQVETPGAEQSAKTTALEAGAAVMQAKAPIGELNSYLDGFHFTNGDMKSQMEAHHYCSMLSEDLTQCVIFDGNTRDAKLMGIEYVISAKLFATLPAEEKHLWHSHAYEVKSGTLIAPGIPEVAEHELMEKLVSTYGKTWHTWHTHHDQQLPTGTPLLMMGFTADGQANEQMVADRDQRFDVSTPDERESRADIASSPIDPDADAWQKGTTVQLEARRR